MKNNTNEIDNEFEKDDEIPKISSFEVIKDLIKSATLSKKEKKRLKKELEQEEEGGNGTIWLKSREEYDEIIEKCEGDLLSPGGAADRVGITRARVHQLESEGKIRVYRMKADEPFYSEEDFKEELKELPFWIRPFIKFQPPKAGCYVFVDMKTLEEYMKNREKE
ncbi:MAG: hypothetical protein HYV59_03005 [Planctomycetes bacterium]|nr:hypothetical protein [Planctomycetota bacterium]